MTNIYGNNPIRRSIVKAASLGTLYGMSPAQIGTALHQELEEIQAAQEPILVVLVQECEKFGIETDFLIGQSLHRSMGYFKKYHPKSVFRRIKKLKNKSLGDIHQELLRKRSEVFNELGK